MHVLREEHSKQRDWGTRQPNTLQDHSKTPEICASPTRSTSNVLLLVFQIGLLYFFHIENVMTSAVSSITYYRVDTHLCKLRAKSIARLYR